jgi:hypothetical protein
VTLQDRKARIFGTGKCGQSCLVPALNNYITLNLAGPQLPQLGNEAYPRYFTAPQFYASQGREVSALPSERFRKVLRALYQHSRARKSRAKLRWSCYLSVEKLRLFELYPKSEVDTVSCATILIQETGQEIV